jgi:serine/threonine-protein kinase
MDTTIRGKNGTYHIIKPLRSGGMGEVLLARDEMDRRVAIKRPFASALADSLARFELEGKAATLEHPNIAKIYETGIQSDGRPYLAMEFVDGKELKDIIDSGEPLDLLVKLSIIEQVCAGLGYAHQKGFIHRDIKPGNVMVQPNGMAKIIDFGIAKMVDLDRTTELTQTSQVIGSLHYIAPERFKNEAMDGRADVFSTGVMLYLLLTGKLPFAGGEVTAAYQIVNEAPTTLAVHIRDYPPALDDIMDQALAKNPEQRFATAEDFGDALHEVIEGLKKTRVFRLFDDAERLTMETRYEPALELLDEAIKLDPSNTQVRKLRKMVREHQERRKRSERVKDYVARAEGFLAVENYGDALAQLKDAQRLDATSQELKDRIALVESTKQRYDRSVAAISQAEAAKNRGDITAALRISEAAVKEDPDNTKLLALRAAIATQLEREAQQARLATLFDAARSELSAKNFPQVERLLYEAEAIDRSHPNIEEVRREMARIREGELLEEIRRHVNDFLRADNYEQATDLLTRAIDKLPGETMLHRLKMEVDTAAQKFDSIRFVDRAVASAEEAFVGDPQKSLAILHQALQHRPGDERLIACERSLREQSDARRTKQLLDESLRSAREFLASEQFDKAIDVLEIYQLEQGHQADADNLLSFSRQELASRQRRLLVDRTTTEARSLIGNERLDDAARLLESALQSTAIREFGDGALSGLLEDVRARQSIAERKRNAILKHAVAHRERGELDTAVQILTEYLATGVPNADAEDLLSSLQMERTRKRVTLQAIMAAEQSTLEANFTAALESLQAVVRAYGESDELAQTDKGVKQARSAHAQKVVAQSIESSRAALLAGDVKGALGALRMANEMVEFADAAKQADWRRIGQAAKKAQSEPTGSIIADPLADLPETTAQKPMSGLVLGLGGMAICIMLGMAVMFLLHKPTAAPTPISPVATRAYIVVKAPPGAHVTIDGGTAQATDTAGSFKMPVSPGSHLLAVTKEGFDPYNENVQVTAGTTFEESILLTKQAPVKDAGTLIVQGNLPAFKVTIDDQKRGEFLKKGSFTLAAGQHTVVYSNDDGSDVTKPRPIVIASGQTFNDAFTLKPPGAPLPTPPASAELGSLVVKTNPNALVSVDGQQRGRADQSGTFPVNGLTATDHMIDISLDNYQPVSGQRVTIRGGQNPTLERMLTLNAPFTGALSVRTTAGAQVTLNNGGGGGTADGQGNFSLPTLKPGTYVLDISKEGFQSARIADVEIAPGSKIEERETLKEKPSALAVVPQPPAADDHSADYKGIETAVSNFVTAYQSRSTARLKAVWLNEAVQDKGLKSTFDTGVTVQISVRCLDQASISADTASQRCNETIKYGGGDAQTISWTYTFVKSSGKWVLKDRNFLR